MPPEKVCKTIHQFSKEPISRETMEKLLEIAEDYRRVKNYVYIHYGGIASLPKLYPGYTIQNEMTASGLRERMEMPSVYFYLALFDALADIKSQWSSIKAVLMKLIGKNEHFTNEEKHYLRFALKVSNVFESVLNHTPLILPQHLQTQYDYLAEGLNTKKLHHYLCRKVRKYLVKQHTDTANGFSISERAYRYEDHGIYLSTKEKRKRVFVSLTDNHQYRSQLYIKLYPDQHRLEIKVPIGVRIRRHKEYTNQVGLAMGMFTMLTTDKGEQYGEEFGSYQTDYAEWIRWQTRMYNRNRENNPGRKKYSAKKRRYEEHLHSYINHELNRLLKEERPQIIYLPKLPSSPGGGVNKKTNNAVTLWQRGYIRKQLTQKCKEHSIKLIEVKGKDISKECSRCGEIGRKQNGWFSCPFCGYEVEEKTNTAQNAKKRGILSNLEKQDWLT